jgi:4'-phosphopantetheinyl transferase EntD
VQPIQAGFTLFPEEERCVSGAVPKRRKEFATGRYCARRALLELGYPAGPIPVGEHREPVWPPGVAGSITHTDETCAAVAVRLEDRGGLGIDLVEVRGAAAILAGAAHLIYSESEGRQAQSELPPNVPASAAIFCAKESVIKAASSRAGRFLDFREIYLSFSGPHFQAVILPGGWAANGCWRVTGRFLLTLAQCGHGHFRSSWAPTFTPASAR